MSQDTYKQRVMLVACDEKSAKLTPFERADGPRYLQTKSNASGMC